MQRLRKLHEGLAHPTRWGARGIYRINELKLKRQMSGSACRDSRLKVVSSKLTTKDPMHSVTLVPQAPHPEQ